MKGVVGSPGMIIPTVPSEKLTTPKKIKMNFFKLNLDFLIKHNCTNFRS